MNILFTLSNFTDNNIKSTPKTDFPKTNILRKTYLQRDEVCFGAHIDGKFLLSNFEKIGRMLENDFISDKEIRRSMVTKFSRFELNKLFQFQDKMSGMNLFHVLVYTKRPRLTQYFMQKNLLTDTTKKTAMLTRDFEELTPFHCAVEFHNKAFVNTIFETANEKLMRDILTMKYKNFSNLLQALRNIGDFSPSTGDRKMAKLILSKAAELDKNFNVKNVIEVLDKGTLTEKTKILTQRNLEGLSALDICLRENNLNGVFTILAELNKPEFADLKMSLQRKLEDLDFCESLCHLGGDALVRFAYLRGKIV